MLPPSAFIVTTMLLLIIISTCRLSKASTDEEEVKVKSGQDVTLLCRLPTATAITLFSWTRPDLKADGYVFFYRNNRSYENYQHPRFRGRVELREEAAVKDGDVSVIVRNVSVGDTGTYDCTVISGDTRSSDGRYINQYKQVTNLTVTASDGDTEDAGDEDAGHKLEYDAVIVAVSVFAVVLLLIAAVGGIMICRKHKTASKRGVYTSPPPD